MLLFQYILNICIIKWQTHLIAKLAWIYQIPLISLINHMIYKMNLCVDCIPSLKMAKLAYSKVRQVSVFVQNNWPNIHNIYRVMHTGTGKTLSLLCGTLKWLMDHEASVRSELQQTIASLEADISKEDKLNAKSSNWLDGQFDVIQMKERLSELKRQLQQLDDHDAEIVKLQQKVKSDQKQTKMRKRFGTVSNASRGNDDDDNNDEGNKEADSADDADLMLSNEECENDNDELTNDDDDVQKNIQVTNNSIAHIHMILVFKQFFSHTYRYFFAAEPIRSCRRW